MFPEHFQQFSSTSSCPSSMSLVLQSSIPFHHMAVLHRFFSIIQALLFHGSASTAKHLLRCLPHLDNNGLRNLFFVYVLYLSVVEYFRIRRLTIVGCSFHAISNIALSIIVYVPSSFFSCFLVRVQASEPYNKTDSNLSYILRLVFHLIRRFYLSLFF